MYLIGNGRLITHDSERTFFENGAVLTDGSTIKRVGAYETLKKAYPDAEPIDANGGVIMPGLINAHSHLYSSLMSGYALKDYAPETLYENLCRRCWRLDGELDFRDVAASAYAGLIKCIKNGVTTVFDHHASFYGVSGSLFAIAGAVKDTGVRGCLSYETSQRCGFRQCSDAIAENESFINYCASFGDERLNAMFGLHAPFTLSDIDISDCVERNAGRTGFHVHVSEGTYDNSVCLLNYGKTPVGRLAELGVVNEKSILVHCVHTSEKELDLIAAAGASVVNCPESNMSNAVGTAAVGDMLEKGIRVGLGTDSFTYDMLETARAFVLAERQRTGKSYTGVGEAAKLLFENNREIAEQYFPKGIGTLKEGAPADVIILDFKPLTRLDAENACAHLILGACGANCTMTMCAGRVLMRDGKIVSFDEDEAREKIRRSSDALWERLDGDKGKTWTVPFGILEPEKS